MKAQQALHGQHALITGGGGGIGAAIAEALAAQGVRLTLVARNKEALEKVVWKLKPLSDANFVEADATDPQQVDRAFEVAENTFGAVTILVNGAGQVDSGPLHKADLQLWERLIGANLTSVFLCSKRALPRMLEIGWGRIVNVASTAGLKGYPYVAAYCAAKHGVVGFTRSLALEVAKKGITVNAVCPDYTETEMLKNAVRRIAASTGRSEDEVRSELLRNMPLGRFIRPEEVADAVVWLCRPESSAINGQCIAVSGGSP
jgi:NAD(P)-dependent dehydrogenase (short-subunit alcohol dehydrogenase family)